MPTTVIQEAGINHGAYVTIPSTFGATLLPNSWDRYRNKDAEGNSVPTTFADLVNRPYVRKIGPTLWAIKLVLGFNHQMMETIVTAGQTNAQVRIYDWEAARAASDAFNE